MASPKIQSTAISSIEGIQQSNNWQLRTFESLRESLDACIGQLRFEGNRQDNELNELTRSFEIMGMGMTAEQKGTLTKFIKNGIAACTAHREGVRERYEEVIEKIDTEFELETKKHDKDKEVMDMRKMIIDDTEENLHEFSIKCTTTKTWMTDLFAEMRRNQDVSKRVYERDLRVMKERKRLMESSVEEKKKLRKSEYDLTSREAWKMQGIIRRMARSLKIEVDVE